MSLYEYQVQHSENICKCLKDLSSTAIDASDTGTGKTYTSIYVAKKLNLKPIIICPKSVLLIWKRVLDLFEIEYYGLSNYESIKGKKWYPYDPANVGTDILNNSVECPYLIYSDKEYTWSGLDTNTVFIFDEAHKCKNPHTINSKLLLSTKDLPARKLLLSATISDKPKFFAVFATMLGFCSQPETYRLFQRKLEIGNVGTVSAYLRKKENSIMLELHKLIYPKHGSRMRIADLGDKFPKNQIKAESYLMDDDTIKGIREAYDSIRAISVQAEAREKTAVCPLAIMIRARQKIESLKVKTICELVIENVEKDNSVVIFVNFIDTMDLIIEQLAKKGHNIKLLIKGGQSIDERQNIIDRFQMDKEHILICQIQSGGVGISLHDTIGNRPRISIISPSWSAQDLVQTFGRIHRAGGKTLCIQKLVYCHGTVEDDICRIINQKFINYLQLNDGQG